MADLPVLAKKTISVVLHALIFVAPLVHPGMAATIVALAISVLVHLGFHGGPEDAAE
jgi:hypothetical protein